MNDRTTTGSDVELSAGLEPDAAEDARVFGADTIVYCNQHMRPHATGWCSVSPINKTALTSKTLEDAYAECRARGFTLYADRHGSNA